MIRWLVCRLKRLCGLVPRNLPPPLPPRPPMVLQPEEMPRFVDPLVSRESALRYRGR